MYNDNITKSRRKRNRIPLSCSNCRRKKIKCDREKPICRICQAHGLTNCVYFPDAKPANGDDQNTSSGSINKADEPLVSQPFGTYLRSTNNNRVIHEDIHDQDIEQTMNNTQMCRFTSKDCSMHQTDEKEQQGSLDFGSSSFATLTRIRHLLRTLKINPLDKIEIYKGVDPILYHASRTNNFGPFSWLAIIKKDPFSTPFNESVMESQKDIVTKLRKTADTFKENSVHLYTSYEIIKKDTRNLNDEIVKILPNKKAIWLFIDRFFYYIYPFMPILDQDSFTKNIERLIEGDRTNDLNSEKRVEKLNVTQYYDLAIIGTLLIVIKFAYETLLSKTGKFENALTRSENDKYLITLPQGNPLIKYSNLCLNEFLLLKRVPLEVLQCAMIMREYQKIDGCDGFADGDSHIYAGLLVQMATSIGLNRDPSFFQKLNSPKESLLRRKIWFCLVSSDNFQYTQTGQSPLIYSSQYDTVLPEFDNTVSNVHDLRLEKACIDFIRVRFLFDSKMRELADLIANMKEAPTIEEVLWKICDLESELQSRFGSYNQILSKPHFGEHYKKIEKLGQLVIYNYSLTFLHPVYMHIYYHYQSTGQFDACVFFHNKILSFWMYTLGNTETLVKASFTYFGEGFDLLLVSMIEISLHKGLIFFISTFIKSKLLIEKLQNNPLTNQQLIDVIEYFKNNIVIKLISTVYIPLLQILSKRFFYSWGLLKAHMFILKALKDDRIDFKLQKFLYNFLEYLTVSDFEMLIQTSNYKNYTVGNKQPAWLCEWLDGYQDFRYEKNCDIFVSSNRTST